MVGSDRQRLGALPGPRLPRGRQPRGLVLAAGIDLAGDGWNGAAGTVRPALVPADEAERAGVRFGSGSVAPWDKEAWTDPETVVTGHPGDHASLARYARWWADACVVCS